MSLLSLFSEDRCIARRETVIAALLSTRGFSTRFQVMLPCWEKLSWKEPKPGSKEPRPETISPGVKPRFGARRLARRQTVAALEDVINAYGSLVGGVELIAYVDVVVAVGSCAYDGGPPSMAEPQGMATLSSIMSIFGRGT